MRLSDIMSHSGLAIYAEIALVLFLGAFGVVVMRLLRYPRRDLEHQARLPLDDGDTPREEEDRS